MTTPADDVGSYNESALEELAWAIEASQGQFSLFLARCNYTKVRSHLAQRLQQHCSVPIRTLELHKSEKTLYKSIQSELGTEKPNALMVFGLEIVEDLEHLLTATNQVREEFQKNFHFPLVLWVNNRVLNQLITIAPDFESWSTTTEFAISPEELTNFLEETAEKWFTNQLKLTSKESLELQAELEAASGDLRKSDRSYTEQEAKLESLLGAIKFINNQADEALGNYQKALELWQQINNLECQGKVLSEIADYYYHKSLQYRDLNHPDWQTAKKYIQQSIAAFEAANRPDLVADSMLGFGIILRRLQDWELLESLAQKALQLHQKENKPIELAQDYGFLAEVALAKKDWQKAKELAEQALKVLGSITDKQVEQTIISYALSQYKFILAQAKEKLGETLEAIRNLEAAKTAGNPEYNTQLYLDILCYLQKLYYQNKQYLQAFQIKLKWRSIEQQYGLRAFIGAGRIQARKQEKLSFSQVGNQENVVQEIQASGRYLDIKELIERIGRNDYKLIIIHGQSGVGKSSLVNGGLVPALKQKPIGKDDVLPVLMRVYTNWVVELGRLLTEALLEQGKTEAAPLNSIAEILVQLEQSESRNFRTVLIFDQFEEFFFVYPNSTERREFFEFLGECLNILPVKVILSLREDYLHYLLFCNRLDSMKIIGNDILTKNVLYPLGNFTPNAAKATIQDLTERSNFRLETQLIDKLVEDLAAQLGEVRPIELQVVGAQLQTENITTLAEYQKRGPKTELVNRYLQEVVKDCGKENQQIAEIVLYLLTDEKGTRPLKTRAELEQDLQVLAKGLSAEVNQLDFILEIFVGSGLVLLLPEKPEDRYQLVHDYLAALIRQQQEPKLKELMAELDKERKQRQQAEQQLKQAEEANKKANQRIKIGSAVLGISLIVAGLTGIFTIKAFQDLQEAQTATKIEREGVAALRQFEFQQIEALVPAMQTGQELKALVKDNRPLEKYPTASPLLALQTILDNIREQTQLKGHQSSVISANFSPDGQRIVTASLDNTARVWDLSGKQLAELKGHQSFVNSANFSPDGQRIVTASLDNTARVWDLSGKQLAELKGHQNTVISANFSPDGQRIVTASSDNTARVWDLSGKQLAELKGHQNTVISANFSPDGQRIVTASDDNTARVWQSVGNLTLLLNRGCQWLNNYLTINPKELDKLEVCQKDPQLLTAAAPFMVKEGEEEARKGNVDIAIVTFKKALKWNPKLSFDPQKKAEEFANKTKAERLVTKGEELAKEGNIDKAISNFKEALTLDSSLNINPETKARQLAATNLVSQVERLVKEGKVKEALIAYKKAQEFDPKVEISADSWDTLCWNGSIRGYAREVMFACEKAVALVPDNGKIRDSRGFARAMTGNTKGAIEDFEAYIASTFDREKKAQRQSWVNALKVGKNPFTPEEIKRLLNN